MKEWLGDAFFHTAAAVGSAAYVLMKPDKRWWQNVVKFAIGYVCAMFTSPMILGVFQWFFQFSNESFEAYLPACGFVTGVLGMTLYETVLRWIRGEMGPLLTEVLKSWLKRKE